MDTFDFFLVCDECKKELPTGFFEGDNDICFDCKIVQDVDKLNIHDWKSILSIDIGIDHLGLSLSHIDSEYNFREVVWIKLINIQNFECEDSCPLQHEKTITDWISHVIFKYKDVFTIADKILIERQPPLGLIAVEQVLFYICRDKAELIHPNSVHSFFGMRNLDYNGRKEVSIRISKNILKKFQEILKQYDREHDISDSVLMTLFWTKKERERLKLLKLNIKRKLAMKKINIGTGVNLNDFFDMYRFIPNKNELPINTEPMWCEEEK